VNTQAGLRFTDALALLKKKGVNITQDQLIRGVQHLCDEGRLYTTIDDEHYKPTTDDF
jgi:hypothetical protein